MRNTATANNPISKKKRRRDEADFCKVIKVDVVIPLRKLPMSLLELEPKQQV
jgi:hypothetical protein